jgi:uncharacterized protein (TIGR03437 family)
MTDGSVVASFDNGDPPLSLVSLQDGNWTSTWQPSHSAAVVTFSVAALQPALNLTGKAQARAVGLQLASQNPPLLSGGPVGVGTLAEGAFAPGDLMLLKGAGLADGPASSNIAALQQQLAGASVVVGGRPASLLYADTGQVIALVPSDVPVNTSQQVIVQRDNVVGIAAPVIIASTHPAVLTVDGSGQGQGLIYTASPAASTLADASNPVRAGDTIIIYCTGMGATDANGNATNTPAVSIGGQAAQVSYAGIALPQSYPPGGAPTLLGVVSAGLGGLHQITAMVPGGLGSGAASVAISSMGQTSQAGVTLTISGGTANAPARAR